MTRHPLVFLADEVRKISRDDVISNRTYGLLGMFDQLNEKLKLRYPVDRNHQEIAWYDDDVNASRSHIPMGYLYDCFIECWSEIEKISERAS